MVVASPIARIWLASWIFVFVVIARQTEAAPSIDVQSITFNLTTVPGGGNPAVGIVRLTSKAPAGGISVALATTDTHLASVPKSVTVPAGRNLVPFLISTKATNRPVEINISAHLVSTQVSKLTVRPVSVASITVGPSKISSGETAAGSIELEAPANTEVNVNLSCATPDVVLKPSHISILKGGKHASFKVSTPATNLRRQAVITATANGLSQSAILTIEPDHN